MLCEGPVLLNAESSYSTDIPMTNKRCGVSECSDRCCRYKPGEMLKALSQCLCILGFVGSKNCPAEAHPWDGSVQIRGLSLAVRCYLEAAFRPGLHWATCTLDSPDADSYLS